MRLKDIPDLDADQLRVLADRLQGLIDHPGWELLTEIIEGQMQVQERQLTAFPPKSRGEMAALAGAIRGLKYTLEQPPKTLAAIEVTFQRRQFDAQERAALEDRVNGTKGWLAAR